MRHNSFDDTKARRLAEYVREHYRETRQIRRVAFEIYAKALPAFEREQMGLCGSVTASHAQISQKIRCDKDTVGPSLCALRGVGLMEYAPGERGPGKDRAASVMRRLTLDELRRGLHETRIAPPVWPEAARLAEALSRPITFDGVAMGARWDAKRTGRVYCGRIQNCPVARRREAFLSGMAPGRLLVLADFKRAEPSVIRELLRGEVLAPFLPDDPYQDLASVLGISRDDAKRQINALAYCHKPLHSLKAMRARTGIEPPEWMREYVSEIEKLRERIRSEAKKGRPPFSVHTLAGRLIHPLGGRRKRLKWPHNGQLLSWTAQGSIADAVVPACLEIIEREPSKRWHLLANLHDGFALDAASEDQAAEAEAILRKRSESAGLSFLEIKMEVHPTRYHPPTHPPPTHPPTHV